MRFKKYFFALFISFLATYPAYNQGLGAYCDYMDRFYIFDNGTSTKFEDQKPQSFKIGGDCILYITSTGHLNMYYKGKVEMLEIGGATDYFANDGLAAYNIYETLKVVYKGQVIELSKRCPRYFASDSLVAFYDKNAEALKVFYEGNVTEIESGLLGKPVKTWAAGDNLLSYISSRNSDFKIWYQGNLQVVENNVENTRFKAGRDVVAYVDEVEQNFKVFYKGEIITLEDFPAKSFQTGDDFVAYVNQVDEFKVFANGQIQTISTFAPQAYLAEDNTLAYVEDNRLKAWYKGEIIEIEAYVPTVYKLDWNTIAYLDNSNRIMIFQKGERKFFANEFVNSFDIYRDLILMNVKVNRNIIYYSGNFYEGQSFYK
jgi:hypothetical protein